MVLVVAVAAILFALHKSNETQAPEKQAAKHPAEQPKEQALSIQGAQIEQKDKFGKVEWKVKAAGTLQFDKNQQVGLGKNVQFEIVQNGKTPIIVKAPSFRADYKAKKLLFTDGVSGRMTTVEATFKASRLEYDFDTRKLIGSGGAEYHQGGCTATAGTIVVDVNTAKARLSGGVKFSTSG